MWLPYTAWLGGISLKVIEDKWRLLARGKFAAWPHATAGFKIYLMRSFSSSPAAGTANAHSVFSQSAVEACTFCIE